MTGTTRLDKVPDVPWGKVAAVVGGLVALRLTVGGVVAVVGVAYREAKDRLFDASWLPR